MTPTTHRSARAVSTALAALASWRRRPQTHATKVVRTGPGNERLRAPTPGDGSSTGSGGGIRRRGRCRARAGEFADPSTFGSTAVIGLEWSDDLQALRDDYGFDRITAIPLLRSARVSLDPAPPGQASSRRRRTTSAGVTSRRSAERRQLLHVQQRPAAPEDQSRP